jgi:hypothetical protein
MRSAHRRGVGRALTSARQAAKFYLEARQQPAYLVSGFKAPGIVMNILLNSPQAPDTF